MRGGDQGDELSMEIQHGEHIEELE